MARLLSRPFVENYNKTIHEDVFPRIEVDGTRVTHCTATRPFQACLVVRHHSGIWIRGCNYSQHQSTRNEYRLVQQLGLNGYLGYGCFAALIDSTATVGSLFVTTRIFCCSATRMKTTMIPLLLVNRVLEALYG